MSLLELINGALFLVWTTVNHRVCLDVEKMAGHTAGDPLECYGVSLLKSQILHVLQKPLRSSLIYVVAFLFSLMLI